MSPYASGTTVPVQKSKLEIEQTLTKYGASRFFYGQEEGRAVIGFELSDRRVQFELPLPSREEFLGGRRRHSAEAVTRACEQAQRERWRALGLSIKAKLVSVESGVETFEEAFLAHVVLPNRQTVYGYLKPHLESAYRDQKMPPLLPAGSAA